MARKSKKLDRGAPPELETYRLPLNKLTSNRDKALRKARDLFIQGKRAEADKAFKRAECWQAKIDET